MSRKVSPNVLSPEVANILEKNGLASPVSNGKRKISGYLLTPPSSPEDNVSEKKSKSSSTVKEKSDFEVIPVALYSVESLEYIGYTKSRAMEIWDLFMKPQDPNDIEVSFEDIIFGNIELHPSDAMDTSDNWFQIMREMGIRDDVQMAIMDPQFENIRGTQTLTFWVLETLELAWDTLVDMNERLQVQMSSKASGMPNLRGGSAEDEKLFYSNRPGHVTLYRAATKKRIHHLFREDRSVNMRACQSSPPGDFNNQSNAWYFTAEPWVADKYAQYCLRRCARSQVVVIQIFVLEQHFHDIKTWKIDFGDEWKKVLWYSRNDTQDYPPGLKEKMDQADAIIGPVSTTATKYITRMKDWQEVTLRNVYQSSYQGQVYQGYQYVWIKLSAVSQLEPLLKDKVNVYRYYEKVKLLPKPWEVPDGKSDKKK